MNGKRHRTKKKYVKLGAYTSIYIHITYKNFIRNIYFFFNILKKYLFLFLLFF